jgi:uncharacterized membrane protein
MPVSSSDPVKSASLGSRLEFLSLVTAALLAAFYLATSIYIGSQRVFWFDELFTIHIARLADLKTMWTALSHGADSQPPFYYMLVRFFGLLFGSSEAAARLPSALGMTAGLLVIFDCVRRLADGPHGLIAMAAATCSLLPYYGYEARPYGIYFLLAALALWVWLCLRHNEKLAALLFGMVMCAGVTMHYYFILCLVPYTIWDLFFGKRGQLASRKLIAGYAGAAVSFALLSPLILAFSHNFATGFWNRPSISALRGIFPQLYPDGLSMLVVIAIFIVLADSNTEKMDLPPMEQGEALGWLFLCIPLAGFVVAELKSNAFYGRYFIGVLPGVAVAFALWTWRHFRNALRLSLGVFLILALWGAATQARTVLHPHSVEATGIREFLELQSPLTLDRKSYIVFSSPLLFIEAQYYAEHPEQCILLLPAGYIEGAEQRREPTDDVVHDASMGSYALEVGLSHYYPLQFWRIDDLKNHAADVALVEPTRETLNQVRDAGLTPVVQSSKTLAVAYLRSGNGPQGIHGY